MQEGTLVRALAARVATPLKPRTPARRPHTASSSNRPSISSCRTSFNDLTLGAPPTPKKLEPLLAAAVPEQPLPLDAEPVLE
eukprot:382472-Prymnesium_polylepis.1